MPDTGLIIGTALGVLFVWILYWVLVLVPRRHRRFYDSLRPSGYIPMQKTDEARVEAKLRELFPGQMEGRSPYTLPRIAVKIGGGAIASKINGEQILVRITMYYGASNKNTAVSGSFVFLEAAQLPIQGDFYVVTSMFGKKATTRP